MYTGGNLTIMVADVDRAVRFYTETLGLPLKTRVGDGWAEIAAPDVNIGLHVAGPGGPPADGASKLSIGLSVDDLDRAMATLRERGVEFAPIMEAQGLRFAFFRDPDKTPLYLWAPAEAAQQR